MAKTMMTKALVILLGTGLCACTPHAGGDSAGAPPGDAGQVDTVAPVDQVDTAAPVDQADDASADGGAPMSTLTPQERAIAGELEGAYLEVYCASAEIEFQFCHPKDMGIDTLSFKFGGDVGKSYDVVLQIYGIMETIFYKNGTKTPVGSGFYIGGDSGTPNTAEYGLIVGDTTYFLNYQEIGAGEHYTYSIEYTAPPIRIPGGSTLKLFVHDPDNLMNTNHMQNDITDGPAGLKPHLDAYHAELLQGQFVYLEVMSAVAAP